ncbi:putative 5-dehydro-4-deoxyglucarate dehydratase [Streptomyces olivaceoviridis]|uniref:5-dehydro-4-deoxyglucarate dehydratase n=1 Tax=Streptomyces olivaceoviridis TaxID=1921 RepID=UPI0016797A37|nr:5-dehydro-4-deoxyglucarate dehydratase [Streptomyces olivaceoviridis]GGZ09394.1 putative 5-dehydro-4-deoxyglucarate dehydratase [Streptomyces olivaceoviridis]
MTSYTPAELRSRLGSGLLSFPVTHFRDDLSFDEDAYRENIIRLAKYDVGGLFAAGGTGEFFSLTPTEVERVVTAAADSAPDDTPILAPAGYGTTTATEFAAAAERAGADGILLFPPYLTEAGQEGLARHVEAVCRSTSLGVVVYSRANAVYSADTIARLAETCPNLIGYKDGVGDIDTMTRIYTRLGERLTYIGGLPTAETFALPYLELGVTTYSSAIFNFLPDFALDFYTAVRERRHDAVIRMLTDFVLPYTEIRDRQPGYAVSIVKAGMTATGHSAGPVRPPLTDLSAPELDELTRLIAELPTATA